MKNKCMDNVKGIVTRKAAKATVPVDVRRRAILFVILRLRIVSVPLFLLWQWRHPEILVEVPYTTTLIASIYDS